MVKTSLCLNTRNTETRKNMHYHATSLLTVVYSWSNKLFNLTINRFYYEGQTFYSVALVPLFVRTSKIETASFDTCPKLKNLLKLMKVFLLLHL